MFEDFSRKRVLIDARLGWAANEGDDVRMAPETRGTPKKNSPRASIGFSGSWVARSFRPSKQVWNGPVEYHYSRHESCKRKAHAEHKAVPLDAHPSRASRCCVFPA
jgi:hypothetical protein